MQEKEGAVTLCRRARGAGRYEFEADLENSNLKKRGLERSGGTCSASWVTCKAIKQLEHVFIYAKL